MLDNNIYIALSPIKIRLLVLINILILFYFLHSLE